MDKKYWYGLILFTILFILLGGYTCSRVSEANVQKQPEKVQAEERACLVRSDGTYFIGVRQSKRINGLKVYQDIKAPYREVILFCERASGRG